MQVSVDTMVSVYAAQSMKGAAAQLAFRLHASADKENSVYLERYSKVKQQQEKEEVQHEKREKKQQEQEQQQKRQKLEHQHHQQHKQQQQQQQQQQVFQQQQVLQHQPLAYHQQKHVFQQRQQQRCFQQQQQQPQQQLFQQQLCQQQQHHLFPMPWLQPATFAMPAPALETAPVPYGRALSTLRHKFDNKIKSYFESLGFCVKNRPEAARVATVFQELCKMRASSTLPEAAKWFEISVTYFDDAHEKPFKDFIRKLYT
jgi:flagellar biosynthesis GTPase FlhF